MVNGVLILVFVDFLMNRSQNLLNWFTVPVLILVFVDFLMNKTYGSPVRGFAGACLNPCFRGLSHEFHANDWHSAPRVSCLNPCFRGLSHEFLSATGATDPKVLS